MIIPVFHHDSYYIEKLDKIIKEAQKTEYEKAREPLQEEIRKLSKKIMEKELQIEAYQQLINEIISNIKDDYIELIVDYNLPQVQVYNASSLCNPEEIKVKKINVPLKENLRNNIYQRYYEILEKHREK